uniref:TIR domain-containing protein n=1 Tax=Biomphalaria glabrata TaxID=6526 RepID=A0A2C9LMU0_BIOGL
MIYQPDLDGDNGEDGEADLTMDDVEVSQLTSGTTSSRNTSPQNHEVETLSDPFLHTNDMLSIFDGPGKFRMYYSAYLCCAQKDLSSFGLPFHAMLEKIGFKIFLPPRDLVITGPMYENMARALEERCNGKIIIVLSCNYLDSEECLFLTYFARVLDPDARYRNLIPVQIDKEIGDVPSVLKGMSIIRYNQAFRLGWLKQKLIDAIAA